MKFAANIYPFGDREEEDLAGVLACVSDAGYEGVEVFTDRHPANRTAAELRSMIGDAGLELSSAYTGPPLLQADAIDATVDYLGELGARDVVLAILPPYDSLPALYDVLAAMAEKVTAAGMVLHHHNHAVELKPVEGTDTLLLDDLMENVPGMSFLVCVYYLANADFDPVPFLEPRKDRIGMIHLKDYATDRSGDPADVGCGVLDFGPIMQFAAAEGHEWLVLENHAPKAGPDESVRISLENARRIWAETIG